MVGEDGVLVFETLGFQNSLDGVFQELVVSAVVGINWVDKEASERDLINALTGVLSVHWQGDEGVGGCHLTASLSWDLESRGVVGHEDRSLDVLSSGQVAFKHQLVEE